MAVLFGLIFLRCDAGMQGGQRRVWCVGGVGWVVSKDVGGVEGAKELYATCIDIVVRIKVPRLNARIGVCS